MSYCKCKCFESKLAYHTAPALFGIKPASLLSVCKNEITDEKIKQFNLKVEGKALKLRVLCECNNRKLMLLYNVKNLEKQLCMDENSVLLKKYGYDCNMSLDEMLDRLSSRIYECEKFPHEIGIFLGYPIEDVKGFIKNKGSNFKFCGYWKVYGDTEKARRTFENYDKCRIFLCNKLSQGADIYQALKIS